MPSPPESISPADPKPDPSGTATDGVERAFRRWGEWMVRYRWSAVLLPLALTAYLGTWLPFLVIDNSTEGFLLPDAPAAVAYREFRDRFSRDDRIIIALAPDDVFDPTFLARLREFHLALEEELPYAEEVTSLFNARSTRGEGDELIVEDLLEGWLDEWPADLSGLDGLRERVLANPLYVNALVSADLGLTTVVIKPFTYSTLGREDALAGFDDAATAHEELELLTARENDELLAAVNAVIDRFARPDFPIHLGGPLAVTDYINRAMARDMGTFFPLALLGILALLYALFRRIAGALLPLLVVLLSVIASIGIMIALEIPGTTAVQILPVFLLTVGVCDAVHILTITYQRLAVGEAKHEAIAYAIGHSGLAVVMTSVTTAAGMMSFVTAAMAPVAQLGVIAPIGVMLALAYTLVMLPGILAIVPMKPLARRGGRDLSGALTARLVAVGDFAARRPWEVLAGGAVVLIFSIAGASQVRFAHLALEWFPPGESVRVAAEVLDRELEGSMTLEVLVDSGRENGLHEPDLLHRLDRAAEHALTLETPEIRVGKAISIVDIVKETHRALHENRPEFYVVPDDRRLVAQELLLFENGGADDLAEFVDGGFRTARLSMMAPFVDAMAYGPFMDLVETELTPILGPDVELELTGFMPVLAGVVSAVIVSMGRSYAFALLVITPMMMLLLRSVRLGLFSMVPNLLPVIFTLGLMGWFGVPLDATQIMIGAMVIGLAVDDTIHFMHKFQGYYAETGDSRQAIRETLSTTGTALLVTSIVLAGGFFIIASASMVNTSWFGLLAGCATLVAFGADVLIAPALMTLVARWKEAPARPVPEAVLEA